MNLRPSGASYVNVATGDDMRSLGEEVGRQLRPGDLVVVTGGLGAGKTTLTQGIGTALGVRGPITSPTFVIARVHPPLRGGPALVHVDAYRLATFDEVDDLDLDASLDDSVTVVEWGEDKVEQLAEQRLHIVIERAEKGEAREVWLTGVGPRWQGVRLLDQRQ